MKINHSRNDRLAVLLSVLACTTCHAATFTVTNTLDGGAGSLSDAIAQANATAGTNTIAFNILPLDGTVKTIFNSNSLPTITRPLIIDGYTQDPAHSHTNTLANADDAVLLIELSGNFLVGSSAGMQFRAGSANSVVRGLVINNFPREAIEIAQDDSITNVLIEGNFIGTDPTGKIARGNERAGIANGTLSLYGPANRLGGTTTGARNIISGNFGGGVFVSRIGGGGHNLVQGNFIGVDATGTNALANGSHGVRSVGSSDVIGGATAGARNVISGNGADGVSVFTIGPSVHDVSVQGNFIGTDATGTKLLPNGVGVSVGSSMNCLIGGTTAAAGTPPGNLIAGNGRYGVLLTGSVFDLRVQGNTITANQLDGVNVQSPAARDLVSSNSIFANGGLGINLAPGANNSQTNPVLTSVVVSLAGVTFQGFLSSAPNTTYTLEFFANDICEQIGSCEGQTFIGSTNLTTDATGSNFFSVTIPAANVTCRFQASATATDPDGNTSEFSACRASTAVDTDGDGACDFEEVLVGTDPNNPASVLRMTGITREGDDIRVAWQAGGGRTNMLQTITSFALNSCSNHFTDLPPAIVFSGAGDVSTNRLHIGGATNRAGFYRVRLVR